jgi:hypothetical protein
MHEIFSTKKFSYAIAISTLLLILHSCQPHFQKRQYRNGFYSSWIQNPAKTSKIESDKKVFQKDSALLVENTENLNSEFDDRVLTAGNDPEPIIGSFYPIQKDLILETEKSEIEQSDLRIHKTAHPDINRKDLKSKDYKKKPSALFYFLSLLILPTILYRSNNANKLSKWAYRNTKKSQVIIAFATVSGWTSSYFSGVLIKPETSAWMISAPLVLYILSSLIYFKNIFNQEKTKKNYTSFSLFSIGSFFLTFIYGAGLSFKKIQSIPPEDPLLLPIGVAIFALIFTLITLFFSIWLITFLACELYCSGYTIWAGTVFFGGIPSAIFLAIWLLLNIFKRKSNEGKNLFREALNTTAIIVLILLVAFLFSLL